MWHQLHCFLWNASIAISAFQSVTAQPAPNLLWQYSYGGSSSDDGHSIATTADGGYIVSGVTQSNDGDVTGFLGVSDFWIAKLNGLGVLEWQRCLGGSQADVNFTRITQTADGGYIFGGTTFSNDGDVDCSTNAVTMLWIAKLDPLGSIEWNTCLGGSEVDSFSEIISVPGGYMVCGSTISTDGNGTGNNGLRDAMVIKLDLNGNTVWSRCYGGSRSDASFSLLRTSDGNYLMAGTTQSNDGDLTGQNPHNPIAAAGDTGWLVKFNEDGDIIWQRCVGGGNYDFFLDVKELDDGAFIAVGYTASINGDVTQNQGGSDAWVVKVNPNGTVMNVKTYGGADSERFIESIVRPNGNTLVVGYTGSSNGDVTNFLGIADAWIALLSDDLELIWQRTLGGSEIDQIRGVCATPEGTAAMVGYSVSINGDLTENKGETDLWVVKLEPWQEVSIKEFLGTMITLYPNPATDLLHVQWSGPAPQTLELLDIAGRLVHGPVAVAQHGAGGFELPVGHLAPGSYGVRLGGLGGSNVARFIKQ